MFVRASTVLSTAVALLHCDGALATMGPAQKKLQKLREEVENQLMRAAEENERDLEQKDAETGLGEYCAEGLVSEVVYEYKGLTFYRPSFFETCADNLIVNSTNMMLHIYALNDVYMQYHCFYDIAKDPENSDPKSYQPELGNTIFGEGGGAVDLNAGMEDIMKGVLKNGSTLATFWEIQTLFNRLYDGHVRLPHVEEDFYSYSIVAFPERIMDDANMTALHHFYLGEDQKLHMRWAYLDSIDENVTAVFDVETIDGKSVQDFIVGLADNPAVGIKDQSTGGRVNELLWNSAGFYPYTLSVASRPSDVMPDSFEVEYSDGTKETFFSFLLPKGPFVEWEERYTIDGEDYIGIAAAPAQDFINLPGAQYDAFQRAVSDLNAAWSARKLSSGHIKQRKLQENTTTMNVTLLDETFAVFKIQTFMVDYLDVIDQWKKLVENAQKSGQTKLIIDLSSNGGGSASALWSLLFSMFPNIDLRWFTDSADMNWNTAMTQYRESIVPLFETLDLVLHNWDDIFNEQFQGRLDNFTDVEFEVYKIASDAMVELCYEDNGFFCEQAKSLKANMTTFVEGPSLDNFVSVLFELWDTAYQYNPFSVNWGLPDNTTLEIAGVGPITVIRGGVDSNITKRFNITDFSYLQSLATIKDPPFDEYIFVSDGTSASAASVVPFVATGLYKNRNRTGAIPKVRLLGYGGTGNAADMTLSSIPAVVRDIHVESPIIGDAALQMLINSLPLTLNNTDELRQKADEYSSSVGIPPYFAKSLPRLAGITFYDVTMDPGALPLQYVRIPLDDYIPKIYTQVTFSDDGQLEELYRDVISYLTVVNGSNPITGGGFVVSQITVEPQWCLTATKTGDFETAGFSLCDFVGMPTEQLFNFQGGKLISSLDTSEDKCLQVELGDSSSLHGGEIVRIGVCSDDVLTSWTYDPETEFIHPVSNSTLCLTNRGVSPNFSDTMHAKVCRDRGDYKWTFLATAK